MSYMGIKKIKTTGKQKGYKVRRKKIAKQTSRKKSVRDFYPDDDCLRESKETDSYRNKRGK